MRGSLSVAPAQRSAAADLKAASKCTTDGGRAHSFRTLLADLSTLVRNTCRHPAAAGGNTTLDIDTRPSELQQKALDLIANIRL